MTQTAVEWLFDIMPPEYKMKQSALDAYGQAKEMEKEQHIKTWGNGWVNGDVNTEIYESVAEQYYNETYKTQTT